MYKRPESNIIFQVSSLKCKMKVHRFFLKFRGPIEELTRFFILVIDIFRKPGKSKFRRSAKTYQSNL